MKVNYNNTNKAKLQIANKSNRFEPVKNGI